MPRVSQGPRYYASKGAWFANLNGERIKLVEGPKKATAEQAEERYSQLVQVRRAEIDGDRAQFAVPLNAFLRQAKYRVAPAPMSSRTYALTAQYITSFVEFVSGKEPKLFARDVRARHVQEWLTYHKTTIRVCPRTKRETTWGSATMRQALSALNKAYDWAAGEGDLLSINPLRRKGQKVPWPELVAGGDKVATTDEEHALLLAHAERRTDKNFSYLLRILYDTGARPAEVYLARADEWNPQLQAFVIDPADPRNLNSRLKTRRHLLRRKRKRIIRVSNDLVPVVQELIRRFPEGPLFRRESRFEAKPWTAQVVAHRFSTGLDLINARCERKGVLGIRESVTLYSYRHAYVTRFLREGGNSDWLCELIDTSHKMLRQHYSHLFEEHDTLLDAVNRFARGGPVHGLQSIHPTGAADRAAS